MRHITVRLDSPNLSLYPVCDVQVGGKGVDEVGFREYIEEAITDPDAHFIGVGDYTDGVSPSNRRYLNAAFVEGKLYDTARDMLDAAAKADAERFCDLVRGTEGRWDVVLAGHHFWTHLDREPSGLVTLRTSDMTIAKWVGAPFVEDDSTAMISYVFPKEGRRKAPVMRLLTRHGSGGGGTFAAPLNQLERQMRAFTAHVYLLGHHHKLVAARAVKLEENPQHPTSLQATDSVLVAGGSWMKGYLPDVVTYAEAGAMVPLATGAAIIRVTAREDGTFRIRTEI